MMTTTTKTKLTDAERVRLALESIADELDLLASECRFRLRSPHGLTADERHVGPIADLADHATEMRAILHRWTGDVADRSERGEVATDWIIGIAEQRFGLYGPFISPDEADEVRKLQHHTGATS